MARKEYSDIAADTTLVGALTISALPFTMAGSTGWPSGTYQFVAKIDDELVLCQSRSGNNVTIATGGRGYSGTTAVAHSNGAPIKHVWDSASAADFQRHVYDTTANDHTQYVGSGPNVVTTSMIQDNAITKAKMADNAIGLAEMDDDAVGAAELRSDAVTTVKILNSNVTTAKIADANVTLAKMATSSVDSTKMVAGTLKGNITFTKAGAVTAGTGTLRWRAPFAVTLVHTRLAVAVAPATAALTVDVLKNGASIYTTKPVIAVSANAETATGTPDTTAMAAGDYLTCNISGSFTAATDLTITIYYTY